MAGKGTRHRFELSRLEIAGVLVSATAGLFVVFLLGIYAGRGLAERDLDTGQQIVRLPVAPAVEQTPGGEDGLTFYDTLGGDERIAKADPRVVVPPADEAPIVPAPPDRKPPAEDPPKAKPAEADATSKDAHADEAVALAKPEPPAAEPKREAPQAQPTPAYTKPERAPVAPSTARVAVALAPAAVPTPVARAATKGDWSVQVSATRDPRTADGVLRRLKGKGYDAFVLKVRRRGETFYRVRVGHYASLEEAQRIVTRLRREPGVPEAFVASD